MEWGYELHLESGGGDSERSGVGRRTPESTPQWRQYRSALHIEGAHENTRLATAHSSDGTTLFLFGGKQSGTATRATRSIGREKCTSWKGRIGRVPLLPPMSHPHASLAVGPVVV